MTITRSLAGVSYNIPERKEEPWGVTVTNLLVALAEINEGIGYVTPAGIGISRRSSATSVLADGATLTQSAERHRVSGSGGAVTLDATTAIADGAVDGIVLQLMGTSDTDTVTILGGANTKMNGDIMLFQGDVIQFTWDATMGLWVEDFRNN